MHSLIVLLALIVTGIAQEKPAAPALPVMPYADNETAEDRRPAVVLASCAENAEGVHGAGEELLASAVSPDFMPRADPFANAVDSVIPVATAEKVRQRLMPPADDTSCVRFLPCCRERMPCCSDAPVRSACRTGCRRGVCGACMPRADEVAIAPLFLPCARQLEFADAENAAYDLCTDVTVAEAMPVSRTMPRADEEMKAQSPPCMPRADCQIEKHALLTPSY